MTVMDPYPATKTNEARWLLRLWHDSRGVTAVEYGLILALVVLVMIGALKLLASTTTGMWNDVSSTVIGASSNRSRL